MLRLREAQLTSSRKHKLRHEKPFKCDVPDCSWETGFPTANDLVRHKSSKHDVTSGKHYICAAPHCSKKSKFWPRADNFRQHVKKLHPELELQEVMDKSVRFPQGAQRSY